MRIKSYSTLIICMVTLIVFSFLAPDNIEATSQTWEQVPIRTTAQMTDNMFGGEGMQMIQGISYAPSNANILYLVTDTSQVWKSEDGGDSWQIKHAGYLANGGLSLAVHPSNENIVLVAGLSYSSYHNADGIYRTYDGGVSWDRVEVTNFYPTGNKKGGVNFAFAGSAGSNTVYAGTHEDGLLISTDDGISWTPLNILTGEKILDLKIHPNSSNTLFIASESGLYKFTDNEPGSVDTLTHFDNLSYIPRAIAVNPSDPNIIYVSVGSNGVYKSTDGGSSFSPMNNGLPSGATVTYLSMSPVNPNRLFASFFQFGAPEPFGNHPYFTVNGGDSWSYATEMDKGDYIKDLINKKVEGEYWSTPIAPHPSNENIAMASASISHLEKTEDGGVNWIYSGNGFTGARAGHGLFSFNWTQDNPDRFAFFLVDVGPVLTTDGGNTFKALDIPRYDGAKTTQVGAIDPTDPNLIITATGSYSKQVIAVGLDDDGIWTQQDWTLWDGSGGTQKLEGDYKLIAFDSYNTNIIYADNYKSTDKGVSWNEILKDNIPVKVMAMFARGNEVSIIYTVEMGQVPGTSRNTLMTVYKSIDGGSNWTSYPSKDIWSIASELAVDPTNEDRLYVAAPYRGVYIGDYDENQNYEWTRKKDTDGLEKDSFNAISTRYVAVDPNRSEVIYAGSNISYLGHSNGMFISIDSGESWENITYNLGPEFTPWAISVNPNNGYVYIGSSHGTWKLPPPYINDLSAKGKKNKVHLSWTCAPVAGGYNIYRTSQAGPYELISVNRQNCNYLDKEVSTNITYYYIVRWLDEGGQESLDSNIASATPF